MAFYPRPTSIRARMTLGFALFIAVLMLAMCAAFFAYTKRSDRLQADARLAFGRQELQRELRQNSRSAADLVAIINLENEDLRAANVAVVILNPDGSIIAQSQRSVPVWPHVGDRWRITSFVTGARRVVVGVEWSAIEAQLRERTTLLLGLSILVVAFSSLAAWFTVGRTLSPIDLLARGAQTASTESLRVQLAAPSRDAEITRLVATLNELLARLGETAAAQGRFYAAASHELRTPLQALSGHLEVALSRPREAAQYLETLRETHAQSERLTSLVQDLLLLNQLEADTSRPPGETLDLADVCADELRPLRVLADERDLSIELDLPAQCEITASWNHAAILVRNLLENAIKYAVPGGVVRVELRDETLRVCNRCAPEADWEAEKLFEPFYRPDASRTSQTGGNGLGLAICKAIAQSNGWALDLKREADIVRARVRFGAE